MSVSAEQAAPAAYPPPTASPRPVRGEPPVWLDRFLGSDPGLTRLLTALQAVVTIGAAMLAEWAFVRGTHALQIDTHGAALPPAQAALIAAQHHGMLVIAIMLGAIMGMMAAFSAAMFTSSGRLLINMVLMPVPMAAGMALGLGLGDHRTPALASLVVVLAVGAYCRRFGPPGFFGGMVLFMGDFFGFFLHAEVSLSDLGWLTAEAAIGVVVAVIAQFTLFYPSRRRALRRMIRSYAARGRAVSSRALELFERPDDRARVIRSLHRRLVRLNEAALMIDAQLGDPAAVPPGWSAGAVHQLLFDSELALTNTARLAVRIADLDVPTPLCRAVRTALGAVARLDLDGAELAANAALDQLREPVDLDRSAHIVVHRFANSVLGFVDAARRWRRGPGEATGSAPADRFEPSVLLFGGWLPGSAMVSATASLEAGPRGADRVRLTPYSRVAIQMAVAVTGAILLGDVLSGRRFYWAVIAAFVTFMGANNAGEQLRKGFNRVIGTVVGVLLGAVGAHLVGDRTGPAIAVILVSLFFGLYLMRISYAFMVIGITIMVSQLYVQLEEFSDSLLRLRLEETALGAGIAAITVLCVVPLRTGRVARVAAREYLERLGAYVEIAIERLRGDGGDGAADLRAAARQLDGAYQSLTVTLAPRRVPPDPAREQLVYGVNASRFYARNLVADTRSAAPLPPAAGTELARAGEQLAASIAEIVAGGQHDDATTRTYVRSAALFDVVATGLDGQPSTSSTQLALRDLQLIDGALAGLATALGMEVAALDTSGAIEG